MVIFFSFISPRTSRRYDPTHFASQRADDDQFSVIEKTAHHVARFAASIGPNSDRGAFEQEAQFFEVDVSFAKNALAFFVVPSKCTNLRKQPVKIFCHREALRSHKSSIMREPLLPALRSS
jgi:hypothetical protein